MTELVDQLRSIVERKMTLHWDMAACQCWLCKAGRDAGCHSRVNYLPHREVHGFYEGDAECPEEYWRRKDGT